MQPRPDIPVRARETMMALQRADWMIHWAQILLSNGQTRGWKLDAEQNDLKLSEKALKEAKDSTAFQRTKELLKGLKKWKRLIRRSGPQCGECPNAMMKRKGRKRNRP